MSTDPQLRHGSDKAPTIQGAEHDLLRYRPERPVAGSGVNAVDVPITRVELGSDAQGLGLTYVLTSSGVPACTDVGVGRSL